MTHIVVVNKSTKVSNADVALMTRAVARQVRFDAAPAWGLTPASVVYMTDETLAPPDSWVIGVMDNSDTANALGWHTEDAQGRIFGRVFATPVLDNGGDAYTKPLSVASVLSHEVLEAFVDATVNRWADRGDGTAVAVEVGDPVEDGSYPVNIGKVPVTVSNFALPAWFDPQSRAVRFDHLGRTRKPFEMTPGGYVVTLKEGKVSQQYGERYPQWRRDSKSSPLARTARRIRDVTVPSG